MSITFNWKTALISLWTIFSILYISYDIWTGFKVNVMQSAYNAGRVDTVKALLDQASNKECKPFNVYMDTQKADLINVACLQQTTSTGSVK